MTAYATHYAKHYLTLLCVGKVLQAIVVTTGATTVTKGVSATTTKTTAATAATATSTTTTTTTTKIKNVR